MAMKKLLLSFLVLMASVAAEAKVVKITLADGTMEVFTSSQLSAIDFNDDGTLTITTYDGQQLPALDAEFDDLTIDDEAVIYDIFPDELSFNLDVEGTQIEMGSQRSIMKVNYVYPSTDPWGEPITLSGTMLIPEEIWSGKVGSEGILMMNHYTKFHRDEAPTISNGELENMLLANPLKPNYIMVESDFYGFGVTERFPQAYLQGLVNARSSLDGLLAARQLLDERGIAYGPLCFNIGYSSGGFDALAAQKLRDLEYADRISFDKTFSGGGPSDVREAYRQYVQTDSTAFNAVPLLLLVCTNEIQQLGIDYNDVFQPYISNRIDELVLSKNFSSWPICDSIGRDKKIHEILLPTYCDLESAESMEMQNLFYNSSLTTDDGWIPDPSQRIFLFHSRGDDYVPIQCARPMIAFLKSKGFEPSIIPGRTHLQTNFVVTDMGHLKATLVYFVQTLAAIKAWPIMYTDNKLNPLYQAIVGKELDLVSIMRQLDVMGFNCRKIISEVATCIAALPCSQQPVSLDLNTLADNILAKMGITEKDLLEMMEDSGIDLKTFLKDLIAYLSEDPEADREEYTKDVNLSEDAGKPNHPSDSEAISMRLLDILDKPDTPIDTNLQLLRDWLNGALNHLESIY